MEGLVVSCAVLDGGVSCGDQLVVAGASRLINDWPDPPPVRCKGVQGALQGLGGWPAFPGRVGVRRVCRGGGESLAWG